MRIIIFLLILSFHGDFTAGNFYDFICNTFIGKTFHLLKIHCLTKRDDNGSVLDCDLYVRSGSADPTFAKLELVRSRLKQNCLQSRDKIKIQDDKTLLYKDLVSATGDDLESLSVGRIELNSSQVSNVLTSLEDAIYLITPQLEEPSIKIKTNQTEAEIQVRGNWTRGPVRMTNEVAQLDTNWETVAGGENYQGFAFVSLQSYKNFHSLINISNHQNVVFSSGVVTVTVSNPNTSSLPEPINLTFTHLLPGGGDRHICVYWSIEEGAWSEWGCTSLMSNSTHTLCSCSHLSSFALLREVHRKNNGRLVAIVGSSTAMGLVVLSLLTTLWCHSVSRKHKKGSYGVN